MTTFAKLTAWLERDSHTRERRKLAAELDSLRTQGILIMARELQVTEQIRALDRRDSERDLSHLRRVQA